MKRVKKLYLQKKKRYLKKVVGTDKRPRLSVFKSHNHIYAQLIDDQRGHTLVSSSTLDKTIENPLESTSNQEASFLVGKKIAQKAVEKGIQFVIFDRGNNPYHGRIKNIAEGARQQGLIL